MIYGSDKSLISIIVPKPHGAQEHYVLYLGVFMGSYFWAEMNLSLFYDISRIWEGSLHRSADSL